MLGFGSIGQFAIGQVTNAAGAELISVDKWFAALSEPVRFRQGLAPPQQLSFTPPDTFPFVSFSWFEELSIPASRLRPQLAAGQQQFLAFQPAPSPFVATGWYSALAEPVRSRPSLKTGEYQFLAYQGDAVTLTPFAWFMLLAEPVRKRPALNAAQYPFFATDTAVLPITKISPWFAPLSEPVRKRAGLDAARQQFLASPSRLLPNPNITGEMRATETGDIFTGGARAWNRVVSGETGLIELAFTGAQIATVERRASTGTSGTIEQVTAPTSGTAVPTISRASIAIIIL